MTTIECARCGTEFDRRSDHTEIVRRDFADRPYPSKMEHLCRECWRVYVEDFLGAAVAPDRLGAPVE